MADRTVTTDLIGRDRISQAATSAGNSLGGLAKRGVVLGAAMKVGSAAIGLAGTAVGKLGGFLVQGVKDAVSYQTVTAKTAAVLKSTGDASGQSVAGIKSQAAALETLSGVDEELIINSQNVLATFTNIKNTGKDKIFDQATKSALDMSVALKTDLQGASIQVGKALNDPIKGVGALSRVGVTFTDGQKKMIAQMVKTGDTAGAQKVILAELNKEFGGAAKAAGAGAAGDWARFQDTISDTGRAIGQGLLPVLTTVMKWLNDKLPGAIATASAVLTSFFTTLKTGMTQQDTATGIESAALKIRTAFQTAKTVVSGFITVIKNPAFQAFAGAVTAMYVAVKTYQTAVAAIQLVTKAWIAIQTALDVVLNANPIGLIILAVVGLSAAIVIAYKRSDTFRAVVQTAFKGVSNVVLSVISGMIGAFQTLFTVLGHLPGKAGQAFRTAAASAGSAKTKVDQLRASINALQSKKITIGINTVRTTSGSTAPGAKALGGPVTAGEPYIVGEHRPELFVPNESGTIIPSVPRQGSGTPYGGGTTTVVHVHVSQPLGTPAAVATAVVDAFHRRPAGGRKLPAGSVG